MVRASIRVLLIESDTTRSLQFEDQLSSHGYQLDIANDLNVGMRLYNSNSYSLILIDLQPGNKRLCEFMESVAKLPDSPAIVVIADIGQEPDIANAMRNGVSDYIIRDAEGGFWHLLPTVLRNNLTRRQLETEKLAMLNALQERNRALSSLNQIGNELTSIHEPDQLISRLMRAAIDVLGVEGGSLWLWDSVNQEAMTCQAVIHRTATPPLIGLQRRKGEGIVGWVAEKNRSTIMKQADFDNRFDSDIDTQINFTTQSLMAVPLRVRDETSGVLEFVNKINGVFDEEDLSLAETLAASASTALENARLVDQLRAHTEDLEERNAELDAFGHTVAHDLQNMLARVVGFAELLALDFEADVPQLDRDTLLQTSRRIANNSRKMSKVIESLLLLSAVRQADVIFSRVDMVNVVGEAVNRLEPSIRESGATIYTPPVWPDTWGYSPWVEEVWFNYISNALKYGGDRPEIELGYDYQAGALSVRLWVRDYGPGVSSHDQQRLFTPFTDIGRKRKSGYGLGLSIVERIVRKLDGNVGVDGDIEQGSLFWFTLPRHLVNASEMID